MYCDAKEFGEKFHNLRKHLGYSLKMLSEESYISINTLRSIERGLKIPNLETLSILSVPLRTDLTLLYSNCKINIIEDLVLLKKNLENVLEIRALNELKSYIEASEVLLEEGLKLKDTHKEIPSMIEQFHLWVRSIYLRTIEHDYINSLDMGVKAIQASLSDFTIDSFESHRYNYDELNILNSLGINYYLLDDVEKANHILEFIFENYEKLYIRKPNLYIKLCYNLSSGYYALKNYSTSYRFAILGIEYNHRNHYKIDYPGLLFRKGVAEFFLSKPEYKDSIQTAIQLYKLEGLDENVQKILTFCVKNEIALAS